MLNTLVMGVLKREVAVEDPCGTLFQDDSVCINEVDEANELGPREKEVVVVGMEWYCNRGWLKPVVLCCWDSDLNPLSNMLISSEIFSKDLVNSGSRVEWPAERGGVKEKRKMFSV